MKRGYRSRLIAAALAISIAACSAPAPSAGSPGTIVNAAPADTPTVTIAYEAPYAYRQGPVPAIFAVTRTGDISQPLTVSFTPSGSAAQGSDYQLLDASASFVAGEATTYVAILPRNLDHSTGDLTVALTLNGGAGYTVGSPGSATITIKDDYQPGYPGVWAQERVDPSGYPIAPQLTYLAAASTATTLNVAIGVYNTSSIVGTNVELWIDADQNPLTGNTQAAHVGGIEYRVELNTGLAGMYTVYQETDRETAIAMGTVGQQGNLALVSIPLSDLGIARAVDVFATSQNGTNTYGTAGLGSRLPLYGTIDSATGQVVVRDPAPTQGLIMTDPAGDNGQAADIRSATFTTVGDQFAMVLSFAQPFDPSRQLYFPGPNGCVVMDTDRNLLTGGLFMGKDIATWGGDVKLCFDLSYDAITAPQFTLQFGPHGDPVPLGMDQNDGTWLVRDNQQGLPTDLQISGSLSLFDAFVLHGNGTATRVRTDGRMNVRLFTLNSDGITYGDVLPDDSAGVPGVVDTRTGAIAYAYQWGTDKQIVTDPPNPAFSGQSGQQFIELDAEIIDNNLVLKGVLNTWSNTDINNLFHIFLDTDWNSQTWTSAPNDTATNGPVQGAHGQAIGGDTIIRVYSIDGGGAPEYYADIVHPDGDITVHDALLNVATTDNASQPGSFTLTLPFSALSPLGPRLRLYATTGQEGGLDLIDIAPLDPMVITLGPTPQAPTLAPGSLTFPNQTVGSTSSAQNVVMTNNGSTALAVSNIATSGDFAEVTTCGSTVGPGANCTIAVTFHPTAAGARAGTLTINDDADGGPHTVALQGTGITPGAPSAPSPPAPQPAPANTATIAPANTATSTPVPPTGVPTSASSPTAIPTLSAPPVTNRSATVPAVSPEPTAGAGSPQQKQIIKLGSVARSVVAGGILTVHLTGPARQTVTVTLEVTERRLVVTGTGKKRRRVARVISLYRVTARGITDSEGRLRARIKVTFRAKKPYQASLTATVSLARKTLKATMQVKITPPMLRTHRHH